MTICFERCSHLHGYGERGRRERFEHVTLIAIGLVGHNGSFKQRTPSTFACTDHNLLATHLGFLFSTKALTPSFIFSPAYNLFPQFSTNNRLPSSAPTPSHPILTPSRLTTTASGLCAAITPATSTALATTSPSTTSFTNPHFSPSSALTRRPVSTISIARCFPIVRTTRGNAPAVATTPRATSGNPKNAPREASTRSAFIAISLPPPRQRPFTAQMMGFLPLRRDMPPKPVVGGEVDVRRDELEGDGVVFWVFHSVIVSQSFPPSLQ